MAEQRRQVSPGVVLALIVAPFVLLVVAEVAAIILVAAQIGWWTLAVMALTTLLGFALFVHEGKKNFDRFREAMAVGREPGAQVGNAMLIFVGAILLVVPGFVTDVVGLLFVLPFTRPVVRRAFAWWLARTGRRVENAGSTTIPGEVVEQGTETNDDGPHVLEGTVVEVDDDADDERQ